jgi:hypothetical protein
MTPDQSQPRLAAGVRAMLRALRWRIRRYVWIQGLASAVVWLGVAFWASLACDWFFEPSRNARVALLGIVGVVLVWVVFRLIVERLFVRLTDANMAMLLERRFPQFGDSLLTAVELAEVEAPAEGDNADECSAHMLAQTCRDAAVPIHEVRLSRVFDPAPLRTSLLAAVLLTAAVGGFRAARPEEFGVWTRRALFLSEEIWPRKTRLSMEGFEDGRAKVARGADLEIIALADLSCRLVPKSVEVRYRTEDGLGLRATMSREGVVDPATDRFQRYAHTFRGVLGDIEFDLIGGDAVVEGLRVEVVDSPTLVEMTLQCRYPDYMQRPERTLPAASLVQIPQGTLVTIRAAANKRLVGVRINSAGHEQYLEHELPRELAGFIRRQEDLRGQTVAGADLRAVAGRQLELADALDPLASRIKERTDTENNARGKRPPDAIGLARLASACSRMRQAEDKLAQSEDTQAVDALAEPVEQLAQWTVNAERGTPESQQRWQRAVEAIRESLGRLDRAESQRLAAVALQVEAVEQMESAKTELQSVLSFRRFSFVLEPLVADKTITFSLDDVDGISSRQPVRTVLAVRADEPPQFSASLRGISSAVTPQARLPVEGKVRDDYGIDEIWFEYAVDDDPPGKRRVASPRGSVTEVELNHTLEAGELDLAPGEKLLVTMRAADRYDLGERPNQGASDRWVLDVVTPDQLRTMLEAREIVLRQRFETIVEDVRETRDSLQRMDFGSSSGADQTQDEDSPARQLTLRTLRVQRALQSSQKDAHETGAVARAFDDIREELINNRIYTEELRIRIEDHVVTPLEQIANRMFPELDRRLDELESTIDDPVAGTDNRNRSMEQVDLVLQSMLQVLERMVELEDFNEAVELLRSIIGAQEELRERTEQRKKDKLRELLED